MDLGKSQVDYDSREPIFHDVSAKVNVLADVYEKAIRQALVNGLPYEYINVLGQEKSQCPVEELAETLYCLPESFRGVLKSFADREPNEVIGEKFSALINHFIEKTSVDLAEDHVTSGE